MFFFFYSRQNINTEPKKFDIADRHTSFMLLVQLALDKKLVLCKLVNLQKKVKQRGENSFPFGAFYAKLQINLRLSAQSRCALFVTSYKHFDNGIFKVPKNLIVPRPGEAWN